MMTTAPLSGRRCLLLSESELILWCARTVVTNDLKMSIRKRLKESINWSFILDSAQYHGVVPLIYRNLVAISPDLVPTEALARLRQLTQAGTLLNRALAKELIILCEAFGAQGIPIMPIKGATLAVMAYGDLSLRDFTDLDILIPEGLLGEAQTVLFNHGYERSIPAGHGAVDHEEGPHHVFVKKRTLSRVDLQWVMAHPHFRFRLDRPEIWVRRISVTFENQVVPGLAPEDLLIILCVHGSKHAWEHLKWVCDVAELLRAHRSLDWEYIDSRSSNWRCRRMLDLGLSLAHRLLDAPLPEGVLARLKTNADVAALACRMPASLLDDGHEGIWEEQAPALYFSLKDSWWERWRFGLLLCRVQSPVIATPPSWFRWRMSLSLLARLVQPMHRTMKRVLSPAIRGIINRWVPHSASVS